MHEPLSPEWVEQQKEEKARKWMVQVLGFTCIWGMDPAEIYMIQEEAQADPESTIEDIIETLKMKGFIEP